MPHHTGTHAAAFAAYGKSQKTNASADPRATEARALRIAARELK